MENPKVRDIMAFHAIDRKIYEKFMRRGFYHELVRDVVCLFMWLDQVGIEIVTQVAQINNHSMIRSLIIDGMAVFDCLRQPNNTMSYTTIPSISFLSKDRIDMKFFVSRKVVFMQQFARIRDGVAQIIFDDNLYKLLRSHEARTRLMVGIASKWPGKKLMTLPLPPELARPYELREIPMDDGWSTINASSKMTPN